MFEKKINNTKICLVEGDITKQKTDAIVNAANNSLRGGGGVDGAIHRAGGPKILEECKKYDGCPTGEFRITSSGNMPSKYVIHTVGPIWSGGSRKESKYLKNCYVNSLKKTDDLKLDSISFPSISTGIYGYPKDKASEVAINSVIDYIKDTNTKIKIVQFVLFSKKDYSTYKKKLEEIT